MTLLHNPRQFKICRLTHYYPKSKLSSDFPCAASRSMTLGVCVCETAIQILPSILMTEMFYLPRQSFCPSLFQGAGMSAIFSRNFRLADHAGPHATELRKSHPLLGSPWFLFILSFTESINVFGLLAMCQAYGSNNCEQDRPGHCPPRAHSLIGCQSLVVRREIRSQVLFRTDNQLPSGFQ